MKVYAVGGSVRDNLLGFESKDHDYVVVGSSAEEMLSLGYEQVGQGFPVFLHPSTREEYALARQEKKVGAGYTGFEFETSPEVSLVQDLSRRDLTINSIAEDEEGSLIDPFGGVNDLRDKILRHTSEAFAEDPLRVVRLARFYARYNSLGFTVSAETMNLAAEMVQRGDLDELPDERFWQELEKAFTDKEPEKFFELLFEIGVMEKVRFFKKNFSGASLSEVMSIAKASMSVPTDIRVQVFAAIVYSPTKGAGLVTARSYNLFSALENVRALPKFPSALEVHDALTKARAWSTGYTADDLILALRVIEEAGTFELYISADKLSKALAVGRAVKSTEFLHYEGPMIGKAMAKERVYKIYEVLM